jgi:hypothetical protein
MIWTPLIAALHIRAILVIEAGAYGAAPITDADADAGAEVDNDVDDERHAGEG